MSLAHQLASLEPEPRPRLAALPMYDPPQLAQANDALWTAIAQRLEGLGVRGVPHALSRGADLDTVWRDHALLLSQTCGYPLMTRLNARLVATPRYRAAGCDGPFHRSAIVVRATDIAASLTDLFGRRAAVNDLTSNTGMNLFRAEIAPLARGRSFFGSVTVTGAHAASVRAVAEESADVAAIDAVTWDILGRFEPQLTRRLRVLHWTVRTPGLPLVTSAATDPPTHARLLLALDDVTQDPGLKEVRAELRLDGFSVLPLTHYRAVLYLEQIAIDQGYADLA